MASLTKKQRSAWMGAAASDHFTSYADIQYGYLDAELGILNLHDLAAKGDFHRVSICLKKGLDPNAPRFDDDDEYAREDTPLICAARGVPLRRGRPRHVRTLDVLLHFGGDINKCNYLEQTPLYVACEWNVLRVAQWLVAHGADVNRATKAGVTPLLCAYRNANAALVSLLLTHGAHAIDPPATFRCIQFPTLSNELRDRNGNQQQQQDHHRASDGPEEREHSDNANESGASEEKRKKKEKEKTETVARPVSSHLVLRPLRWKSTRATTAATDTATTLIAVVASPPKHDDERMRQEIATYAQQQQSHRAAQLEQLDERRRIQEQQVYRERLAVENAKRKHKRLLTREKASYEKYVARVETRRRHHTAGDSDFEFDPSDYRPSTTGPHSATTTPFVRLCWSQQLLNDDKSGDNTTTERQQPRRVQTAASRVGRPTWIAQELSAMQVVVPGEGGREDGDDKMLQQCRTIFDTVQRSRDRREQLRQAYTTPMIITGRLNVNPSTILVPVESEPLPQLTVAPKPTKTNAKLKRRPVPKWIPGSDIF